MTAATPPDLLVRNAELLVTMTGEEVPGGWVSMRDGVIDALGGAGDEPAAAAELSARGCLVTPGLINTHHHIFQNLMRSYAPVVNSDWLVWREGLGGTWARVDEEASYVSAWIGLAELALGGCTTTSDHIFLHPHPRLVDGEIAAAGEVGLRLHAARGAMDMQHETGGYREPALFETPDEILADFERLASTYHDPSPTAMIQIAFAPCSLMDSSPEVLRGAAELAERLDVRLHTHLAMSPPEADYCLAHYGQRPVDYFEELGWAGSRSWVAHCNSVNSDEINRLAGWGTGVAHCPSSNMLLGLGAAPVGEMLRAGVRVGLGCDGSAATDHASLWLEARAALLLGRLIEGAATGHRRMGARDVLEIATVGSAACLGRTGELGVLAPGACADLVAWPLEGVRFAGAWSDPVEAWLRCGPVDARHTVVGGRVIVRNGTLELPKLDEMLREHERISRSWQANATEVS
jgi:cytosine/adenosine deaminase-related metal-dependent hydrolase